MGRKKRTKSQASPDSVSTSQEKRQAILYLPTKMSLDTQHQTFVSPQSQPQSPLSQYPTVPPNPGHHEQLYTPPNNQYMVQSNQISMSPKPATDNFQQFIIDKLEAMDTRLNKLDSIDSQLSNLTKRLSIMDTRVSSVETSITDTNKRLIELEVSRSVDSQSCDEIRSKQKQIDTDIKQERIRSTNMKKEFDQLKLTNKKLTDDIVDLQSRSMRDNLLFFNFDELPTPSARSEENCVAKILDFCINHLNIPDARESIKIDRANRIGIYDNTKKRPILVKFNCFQDKTSIKQCAYTSLKNSHYRVSDQYPKAIQNRRRALIPHLINARDSNKRAVLSYDKLYIDGDLFTGEATPVDK